MIDGDTLGKDECAAEQSAMNASGVTMKAKVSAMIMKAQHTFVQPSRVATY
jgi:hypothetical protein